MQTFVICHRCLCVFTDEQKFVTHIGRGCIFHCVKTILNTMKKINYLELYEDEQQA